ncbi:hypothetical protein ACFYMW_24930 [Streptomyces sp. NPDC006692]
MNSSVQGVYVVVYMRAGNREAREAREATRTEVMGEILDRTRMAVEPAAITRKGRTLAYLVPAEWFEHYQELAAAQDTAGQDAA